MAENTNTSSIVIANTFGSGLNTDALEGQQPRDTYRYALNAVRATADHGKGSYLANEASQRQCGQLPEGHLLRGYVGVEDREWFIVASVLDGVGYLGYLNVLTCQYHAIISDLDVDGCSLGITDKEWITDMDTKVLQPCNSLTLYYSSSQTYYRIRVDEILEGRQKVPVKCADVLLFACQCTPRVNIHASQTGGVDLLAGAYKAAIQLEDEDGNTTNWFPLSETAWLGSEKNRVGEPGRGSLAITVDAFGGEYEYANIAIVRRSAGAVTARIVKKVAHGGSEVGLVVTSESEYIREISIEELLTRKPGYLRGEGLVQHDGTLYLYAIRGERNLNYQRRALAIRPSYKVGLVPAKYADQFTGFRGGETYAAQISFNFCDGTSTRGFVLRGNGGANSNIDCGCPDPNGLTNGTRKSGTLTDNYSRVLEKALDQYEPFEPTDQGLLTIDDADIPDIDKIRRHTGDGGGGGDDCDCRVINMFSRIDVRAVAVARVSLNMQDVLAALEILEKACRCGQRIDGGIFNFDGLIAPVGATFNDADVSAIRQDLVEGRILQNNFNDPLPSTEDIKTLLQARYSYIPSATETDLGLRRQEDQAQMMSMMMQGLGDGSSGSGSGSGEVGSCFTSAGNGSDPTGSQGGGGTNPGGGGEPTDPDLPGGGQNLILELGTSGGHNHSIPNNPNTAACDDDVSAGGIGPGYDSEVANTGPNSSYPKPKDKFNGSSSGGVTSRGTGEYVPCTPEVVLAEDCCTVIEVIPCIDGEGELAPHESCELYPETVDCQDQPMYGDFAGKPVSWLKFPGRDIEPHFIAFQDGVPTQHNRDNHESANTFVRFLWLHLENIEMPRPEELDKPLCPFNPFTISIVERTPANKTVVASGLATNVFLGNVFGETVAFPRNGVNGRVAADRYVNDNGARRGQDGPSGVPMYIFHSPDTLYNEPNLLSVDYADFRQRLRGRGYRHGLYAEGPAPDSAMIGRKNRKGARQQANVNHWQLTPGQTDCVAAAAQLYADTFGDRTDGFTHSISNLFRENSVVFETTGEERVNLDGSFDGVVSQHEASFDTAGFYVDLRRRLPSQYGSVTSLAASPIHQGSAAEARAGICTVMRGDSFIGRMTVKRTSYVSDKVGPDLTPAFEFGGGINEIPLISRLLRFIFSTVGGEECGCVPVSGNVDDPRNDDDANGLAGGGDTYYPQVQTTLVSFWAESDVNLPFREGGDSAELAHYDDLGPLSLDPVFGGRSELDSYYMTQFYATLEENPKWKMIMRIILNFLFTYVVGFILIIRGFVTLFDAVSRFIAGVSTSLLTVMAAVGAGLVVLLGVLWIIVWVNTNLDNRFFDSVLGIKSCFPDFRQRGMSGSQWRMRDTRILGWMADVFRYTYDLSTWLPIEVILGIPFDYNTCDCLQDTGVTVYYSNKQNPGSWKDAYRNFQANSYLEIPAETGPVLKMFSRANILYALTSDMPYQLSMGDASISTDAGRSVVLQPLLNVSAPKGLFAGISEGHAGILDPNATKNNLLGFVYLDREAGLLYMLSGSGIDTISMQGVGIQMADFLRLRAVDQNVVVHSVDQKHPDGVGFEIGWDPALRRILITKKDVDSNGCDHSGTWSYDGEVKAWISEHSYRPQVYMSDRRYLYSVDYNGKVWIHDAFARNYMRTYDQPTKMIVEFVSNLGMTELQVRERMAYESTEIIQSIRKQVDTPSGAKESLTYFDKTFDTIQMWGPGFSTKERRMIRDHNRGKEQAASFTEREVWFKMIGQRIRFNSLTNLISDIDQPIFDGECNIDDRTENEDNHLEVPKRLPIRSDWYHTRLVLESDEEHRMYLEAVLNSVKYDVL